VAVKKKKRAPPPPCEEPEPEPKDEAAGQRALRPVDEKIGEPRDNLKRRGEWFRRRSGGGS
jgi:hypothetical protein